MQEASKLEIERPPCRFHALGKCKFGDQCTFSHTPAGRQVVCKFFTGEPGSCRYGKRCLFQHKTPEEITEDEKKQQAEEEAKGEADHQYCGVCFENIPNQGKRYGLLTACDHVFCYECVREWRQRGGSGTGNRMESTLRRSCPSCRQLSEFVLPSRDYVTGSEKEELMSNYKIELSKIPCKNFDAATKSGCAFAKNCYFAHLNEEGEDIKAQSRPPPRPHHNCPFSLPEIGARLARLRTQLDLIRNGVEEGEGLRVGPEDLQMLRMLDMLDLANESGFELFDDSGEEEDSNDDEIPIFGW